MPVAFLLNRCLRVVVFAVLIGVAAPAVAQTPAQGEPGKQVRVGTKLAPPFAMQLENGSWTGLAIDLWQAISDELGRTYGVTPYQSTKDLIDAASRGDIDAGVAAVTITADREQEVDFSHPFFRSGLAIAISKERSSSVVDTFRALTSGPFLATIGMLLALLFATGALIWVVERKRNSAHFDEEPVAGIGHGFWWAAVTMTTVATATRCRSRRWDASSASCGCLPPSF